MPEIFDVPLPRRVELYRDRVIFHDGEFYRRFWAGAQRFATLADARQAVDDGDAPHGWHHRLCRCSECAGPDARQDAIPTALGTK
ncbi:MAG: hypothetical protein AB7O67_23345 [Vicinamibacterales bacterium]